MNDGCCYIVEYDSGSISFEKGCRFRQPFSFKGAGSYDENWRMCMQTKKKKRKNKDTRYFWLFILPWVIGFLSFTLFPMVYSFVVSFTNWNGQNMRDFIGLKNFIQIFTKDRTFWSSLKITFKYILISVPLNTVFAIFLAVLLNKHLPGRNLFRGIFYLPTICSGVKVIRSSSMVLTFFGSMETSVRAGFLIFSAGRTILLFAEYWLYCIT